jgi:hypothetical protein
VELTPPEQFSGSGMFISIPIFFIHLGSRIQQEQQMGGGANFFSYFFVATNVTELNIIFFLNSYRKFFEPIDKQL